MYALILAVSLHFAQIDPGVVGCGSEHSQGQATLVAGITMGLPPLPTPIKRTHKGQVESTTSITYKATNIPLEWGSNWPSGFN